MKRWLIGLTVVFLIGVAVASFFMTAYTDYGMACEFTCSHQGYRQWCLGMRTKEWYRVSPIERRLGGTSLKHQWVSYRATKYNVFGQVIARGRGRPHNAALSEDLYWPFYQSFSDDEIRSLYEAFQTDDGKELDSLLESLDMRLRAFHSSR